MGRSTFEGPVLAGDNRFGQQRDVGTAELSQTINLNLLNNTPATAGYSGGSSVFASSNNIPNNIGTIWTPQAGAYSTSGPTVATVPTADSGSAVYRGAVFMLPQGCSMDQIFIDTVVVPTNTGGAITVTPYISNNFATSAGVYATAAAISAVGRTQATYTATQYPNAFSTLQDVQNIQPGNQPTWFSQVVVTIAMTAASGLTTISAGNLIITIKYKQNDANIGNGTTYPYGNFD